MLFPLELLHSACCVTVPRSLALPLSPTHTQDESHHGSAPVRLKTLNMLVLFSSVGLFIRYVWKARRRSISLLNALMRSHDLLMFIINNLNKCSDHL